MSSIQEVDLTHYDFREDFSLQETAALCVGLEPRFLAEASPSQKVRYEEVLLAACTSVRCAENTCAEHHAVVSVTRHDLPPGLLYPSWALDRFPHVLGGHVWDEAPIGDWPEPDTGLDEWRFHRNVVIDWLAGRAFVSGYDFARPGGAASCRQWVRADGSTSNKAQWPWGEHSTGMLELLAAAANEFWTRYNAAMPDTAPKSDNVRDWLVTRGASQNIADAMATILRPKDIPAGPRKRSVEPK